MIINFEEKKKYKKRIEIQGNTAKQRETTINVHLIISELESNNTNKLVYILRKYPKGSNYTLSLYEELQAILFKKESNKFDMWILKEIKENKINLLEVISRDLLTLSAYKDCKLNHIKKKLIDFKYYLETHL